MKLNTGAQRNVIPLRLAEEFHLLIKPSILCKLLSYCRHAIYMEGQPVVHFKIKDKHKHLKLITEHWIIVLS